MLALTRKIGQTIIIADNIVITVVTVKGDQVRLAIEAPQDQKIYRGEIYEAIRQENENAAQPLDVEELSNFMKKSISFIQKNKE